MLEQTFPNFEVVVDDGYMDGTPQVLASFQDPRSRTTTKLMGINWPTFRARDRVLIMYRSHMHLLDGAYLLSTDLAHADLTCYYDYAENTVRFFGCRCATCIGNCEAVSKCIISYSVSLPQNEDVSPSTQLIRKGRKTILRAFEIHH